MPTLTPTVLHPPLDEMHVTSPFGLRVSPLSGNREGHAGVDLRAPEGTPVRAAADAVVWRSYLSNPAPPYLSYGECIWLDHGDGWATRYAHLSRRDVDSGDRVRAGDIIGLSGNTGASAGPHLHFELRHRDAPHDPMQYINAAPTGAGDALTKGEHPC